MQPRYFLLLAVALLAGGCISGSGAPKSGPSVSFDETTGVLQGLVMDVEAVPLEGVLVGLLPGNFSTSTGAGGSYALSNVPPGKYAVFAQRLGFKTAQGSVEIVAGEVAEKSFNLEPLAVTVPRSSVFGPFDGYMQCRMGTLLSSGARGFIPVVGDTPVTTLWANDKVLWDFGKLQGGDWSQIVFESRWKASTFATNPNMMQVFSYSNRTSAHWFSDSGSRASPIKFVYSKEEGGPGGQHPGDSQPRVPNEKIVLRTWLTTPFGTATRPSEVAYELRFKMAVTIFYSQEAMEKYTALPDQ